MGLGLKLLVMVLHDCNLYLDDQQTSLTEWLLDGSCYNRGSLAKIIGFVTLAMLIGSGLLMRVVVLYEQAFHCLCFVEGTL